MIKLIEKANMSKSIVVVTSGYFNPITPEHVEYFYKAKESGDKLVIILNRDDQLLRKRKNTRLEGNN